MTQRRGIDLKKRVTSRESTEETIIRRRKRRGKEIEGMNDTREGENVNGTREGV